MTALLPFTRFGSTYKAGFCHLNVLHRMRAHGGSREFGWLIWEYPGATLEAEFHAVWRSPVGELIDLTPRVDRESHVAFVPDKERRLERHEGLDMSWANYPSLSFLSEPTDRFLIMRDQSLARQMARLGFSQDEPLS